MNEDKIKVSLENYLDLLIDEKIDGITNRPICIGGISDILTKIYWDLKRNIKEGEFQKFMKEKALLGILAWKNDLWPIPLPKVKKILLLWKEICNKSWDEHGNLYEKIYQTATYFSSMANPVRINAIKSIDIKLAYFLGILYADGSLRNIWLTLEKGNRFRWEITVTEELKENLETIIPLLEEIFGIKTNVKTVYNGKWYRILFHSMILFRILNRIFEMPMGYKKGKLSIPKIIKNAPHGIKKYFLIGFFDGDGWCSNFNQKKRFTPILAVNQSSSKILEDLNEILKEVDFNFHINIAKRYQYTWYTLVTKDKRQIKKFQDEFGFLYKNKKERLKILVNSFYNGKPRAAKIFRSLVSQGDN